MTLPARDGLPPMGNPGGNDPTYQGERHCARSTNGVLGPGETLCGKPASVHVVWEDTPEGVETAWACDEHAAEIRERWRPLATHPKGSCCGMPGSKYSLDLNVCFYPGDELPTVEPVRSIALPVPAATTEETG